MRVDFVANASHELRTPLASLLGFVETLRGAATRRCGCAERFLAIMETQARRMARLVDDLLSLSRIELKAHVRPMDRVDLGAVVRQIADALKPLAAERGTTLTLAIPERGCDVPGDRDELLRVFENLIENAIKYGKDQGQVQVTLRRLTDQGGPARIEVAVTDDGPGVAPQHLPRLTERSSTASMPSPRAAPAAPGSGSPSSSIS